LSDQLGDQLGDALGDELALHSARREACDALNTWINFDQ
jgi:hypothetical protein